MMFLLTTSYRAELLPAPSSHSFWISGLVKSLPSLSGALTPFPAWAPSLSTSLPLQDPSRTSWTSTTLQREQSCPCALLQMCPGSLSHLLTRWNCTSQTRKRSSRGKIKFLSSGTGKKRSLFGGFQSLDFWEANVSQLGQAAVS